MSSLPSARRRLWVHTKYHTRQDKTKQDCERAPFDIDDMCEKSYLLFRSNKGCCYCMDRLPQWCIIWGSITLNLFQTQPSPVKLHVGTPCFLLSSLSQHGGSGRFPCAKENGPCQYFGVVFPANRKLNTTSCYFSVLY